MKPKIIVTSPSKIKPNQNTVQLPSPLATVPMPAVMFDGGYQYTIDGIVDLPESVYSVANTMITIDQMMINDTIRNSVNAGYDTHTIRGIVFGMLRNISSNIAYDFYRTIANITEVFFTRVDNLFGYKVVDDRTSCFDYNLECNINELLFTDKPEKVATSYFNNIDYWAISSINFVGTNIWDRTIISLRKICVDPAKYYPAKFDQVASYFKNMMSDLTFESAVFSDRVRKLIPYMVEIKKNFPNNDFDMYEMAH